eukprot:15474898-Alexandrium_andersonii.AAC.1
MASAANDRVVAGIKSGCVRAGASVARSARPQPPPPGTSSRSSRPGRDPPTRRRGVSARARR